MTISCPNCYRPIDDATDPCPHCGSIASGLELAARTGTSALQAEPGDSSAVTLDSGVDIDATSAAEMKGGLGEGSRPVRFGPYRVVTEIGRGGMGVVYHARHDATNEDVAIKTVLIRQPGLVQRIRREVRALGKLRHPGLIRIIATGHVDGLPWYAMELLRGQTLYQRMRRVGAHEPPPSTIMATAAEAPAPGPHGEPTTVIETDVHLSMGDATVASGAPSQFPATPPESAAITESAATTTAAAAATCPDLPGFLTLIARLCHALAYLHAEGIVHRDLKPQNVVIRGDDVPVLLDFGLASYFGASGREILQVGWKTEGTAAYMSPEQIRGEYTDARTDLYAIGCILYEGVTGRAPFQGPTFRAILNAQLTHPPAPFSRIPQEIPGELEDLVLRLLSKRARDRVGRAREVVSALVRLGAEPGGWPEGPPLRDFLYRPEFAGRRREVAALKGHIAQAIEGGSHCIFLRGHSGIGKTRVILELTRLLESAGRRVVTGECLPLGADPFDDAFSVKATSLHPFRLLLQAVADHCVEGGPAVTQRLLGPRAATLAGCEPLLSTLVEDANGSASPEVSGDLRFQLLDALGQTLVEFSKEAPIVLFLDDLQWADELSLNFLAMLHVGAWGECAIAVVGVYRAEDEQAVFGDYAAILDQAPLVELGRLDDDSLGQIARDMLGFDDLDDRFTIFLARQSGGNPFFIAEYLRTALAEGLLICEDGGRWRVGPAAVPSMSYESLPLPGSLHELVARRIEGLPAPALAIVELLAVLGREVDGALLERATPLDDDATLGAIGELLARQVLDEDRDGKFRFVHDKLREIAYEGIDLDRRRELHRRAAKAIQAAHASPEDLERHDHELALHWSRSINPRAPEPERVDKAVEHLGRAATQAVHLGLPREGVDFGLEAVRLLGVAIPSEPAEIAAAIARELEEITRLQAGRRPADLLELPSSNDPEAARVIGILLSIHPAAHESKQFDLFAMMACRNLSLTLAAGNGPLSPCVYAMFSIVSLVLYDDTRLADEYSRLAIELDARRGGTFAALVKFVRGFFVSPWVAPLADSLSLVLEAAEAGFTSGDVLYASYSLAVHAMHLSAIGTPLATGSDVARRHLERIGRRVPIVTFHLILEIQFAKALAGRTFRPLSLSDAEFDEARDLAWICRTSNFNQIGAYHTTRLRLAYFQGDLAEALRHAGKGEEILPAFQGQVIEIDFRFFHALALLGHASSSSGSDRDAMIAKAAIHLEKFRAWEPSCPENFRHKRLLVESELAFVEGRLEQAAAFCLQAARAADAQNHAPHAALAFEIAARRHAAPDAAGVLRDEAIRRYESWGAMLLVQRLRRLS